MVFELLSCHAAIQLLKNEALTKEGKTHRRHALERSAWKSSSQPAWLTPEFYSDRIQPLLAQASPSAIAQNIGVSRWYAGRIREGHHCPSTGRHRHALHATETADLWVQFCLSAM